jgi:hypothetical protein
LYYFKARYYDSAVGRFLSADTIVPNSNNPQSFNRYSYAYNNPLNYTDPSGHMPTDGCQTEGCQTDEGNETYYYIKYLEEHGNEGLAELTKYWYGQTLANLATWSPENGPLTAADDPFLLTLQAVNTDARANAARYGLTPGGTLTVKNLVNGVITLGVIFGGGRYIQGRLQTGYDYVESYLPSRGMQSSVKDILMPGGQPIGTDRGNPRIRTLQTEQEMRELFDALKVDAKPYTPKNPYDGQMYELPNGRTVGWRNISESGGPAIDVNIPGIPIKKIHLP